MIGEDKHQQSAATDGLCDGVSILLPRKHIARGNPAAHLTALQCCTDCVGDGFVTGGVTDKDIMRHAAACNMPSRMVQAAHVQTGVIMIFSIAYCGIPVIGGEVAR